MTKGILYYTDNRLDPCIMRAVQKQILKSNLPVVSVSLQPINFGQNIVLEKKRGVLTMFEQILAGLEACRADIIFFCEHDVLYHPSHFEFMPLRKDVYYYNENCFKVDYSTGRALFYYARQTSGLSACRGLLMEHYRKRVDIVQRSGYSRAIGFEPGTHNRKERVDNHKAEAWMSAFPNIDIRHKDNLTASRWSREQFRNQKFTEGWTETSNIPGWGETQGRMKEFLEAI